MIAVAIAWLSSFRLRYLLFACAFLSPLVPTALGVPLSEGQFIISPTRIADALFFAGFFFAATRTRGLLRHRFPLATVFTLYVLVRVASLFVAPERAGALIQLFGEAGLMTVILGYLAFCVVRKPETLNQLVSVLLAGGIVISLIGVWEYSTQRDFSATVIRPVTDADIVIWEGIELKAGQIARVRATLDHPLAMAGWMVLLFPLVLQRAIIRAGLARIVYSAMVVLFGIALFLTFSRIAQFAAILQTMAVMYLYARRGLTWFLAAVVGAGVCVLIPIYKNATEIGRGTSLLVPLFTLGVIGRRWIDLARAFSFHPVAALVGFGFTRQEPVRYTPETMMFVDLSAYYSRIDTDIVRVIAVTGILGFLAWIGIFAVFFRTLRRARLRAYALNEAPIIGVAIAVAGCVVTALPGTSVLTYTQTWPIIVILMSAALGVVRAMPATAPVR